MHPTQIEILESLRQDESKQFGELLRDVAETSDNLTYHLKQLQKNGFIESPEKGSYKLAQKGIVYLNNNLELQHDLFPTVSCMLKLHGSDGTVLVMKKLKQPYLGKLHLLTFGVTSAATLQAQIKNFLERYKIEASGLKFKAVHRERVRRDDTLFVFDKFFFVFDGAFAAFESNVEDREILAMPTEELSASPQTLSATKTVLGLDDSGTFTEATVAEQSEI